MKKDDCYFLGTVTKPHGLKGEVYFFLDVDDVNEYEGLDAVFLDLKNSLVPLFIDNFNILPNGKVIVKLEDFESRDDLAEIIGKPLYLPLSSLPELKEDQFYFHEVTGFIVSDKNDGELGPVKRVLEYPKQALLEIDYNGIDVLIPISDEIIEKVNKKEKTMLVNLPEGLLEIYS